MNEQKKRNILKRLYEKLYGHGTNQAEPFEIKYGKKTVALFANMLAPVSLAFVGQTAAEAKKQGLPERYLPYLWWSMHERRGDWPEMARPKHRAALHVALELVWVERDLPPFGFGFEIPPADLEWAVQDTIKAMGKWSASMLLIRLIKLWNPLMRKAGPVLVKSRPGQWHDAVEAEEWFRWFMVHAANNYPHWFTDHKLMKGILTGLFL